MLNSKPEEFVGKTAIEERRAQNEKDGDHEEDKEE